MLNWVLDNKEWIFSGTGVALVAAAITWLFHRLSHSDPSGTPHEQSEQTAKSQPASPAESHWDRLISSKVQEPSMDLRDYSIEHTPACLDDLSRLHLTREDLFSLVQSEFRSHLNYFRFDLEDYMMPVKASYIVYMAKVGNSLAFKRILPCTKNEAKLSSWSDILAMYRRATRLAYRDDPNVLFTRRGQFGAAVAIHLEIERRIVKHFEQHEGLIVEALVIDRPAKAVMVPSEDISAKDERQRIAVSVAFHLLQSSGAQREGTEIVQDLDNDIRTPQSATGDLVACLERSLQHLHKILILFPPIEETRS